MSIMIKGIDMPKNCYSCWLGHKCPEYEALLWNEISKERKADCPLVPVPPHGRLIDADALMLMIQEYIDEYGWDVDEHGFHSEKWCAMKETEMAINDAPTVIPADKDGES